MGDYFSADATNKGIHRIVRQKTIADFHFPLLPSLVFGPPTHLDAELQEEVFNLPDIAICTFYSYGCYYPATNCSKYSSVSWRVVNVSQGISRGRAAFRRFKSLDDECIQSR